MSATRSQAGESQPEVVYCMAHPEVETGLRCGRCETPICPRCMVMTPVGGRCPDCARPPRVAALIISPIDYAQATAAALGVALALGIFWGLLPWRGYGNFVTAAAIGFAAGEAVSRIVRRRQSLGLQILAGAAVLAAYIVSAAAALWPQLSALPPPAFVEALVRVLVRGLTGSIIIVLALALGVYIAVTRISRWR